MNKSNQYGVKFHFDNYFNQSPEKFSGISLYQFGELYFENGMEVPVHKQWCHEISYIISGHGIFQYNGVDYIVKEGDIFISPLDSNHAIKAAKDSTLRYAYVGFTFNEDSETEDYVLLKNFFQKDMEKIHGKDKSGVLFPFFRNLEEFYRKQTGFHMMAESYIKQILVLTLRSFEVKDGKDISPLLLETSDTSVGTTIYSILRFIDDNIFNIRRVSEISDALTYNQSYISDLFKKKMGMTMQQYINTRRIEKAVELLEYGKFSVTKVAEQLNYASVQSFCRAFARVMKLSPSQYLKQLKSRPH